MYKKGDLVRLIRRKGQPLATVMRDEYTARFLDGQDYEMMEHGMGHLAGTYGGAVDVRIIETMETLTKVHRRSVKLVSSQEEA